MKVWEETWDECDGVVAIEQKHERDFFVDGKSPPERFPWEQGSNVGAFGDMSGASPFNPLPEDVARARLAAAAPELARALLAVLEDVGEAGSRSRMYAPEAYAQLDAALRKAGVR